MSVKNQKPPVGGDYIEAHIGDNANQVAVGKGIVQKQAPGNEAEVTEADLEEIRKLFADLKQQIEAQAPPDKKAAALERAGELEEEVTSKKPSLTTMEYVRDWFAKNAPGLVGSITSVVINPIVGKVVQAAGEIAVSELKRRFGQ
jgi:hypothetical protein